MIKFYEPKFFLALLTFVLINCIDVLAQQPAQINYQGVARKADGSPVPEQQITLRLTIRDGATNSPAVYSETRQLTTNKFGLFTTVIGGPGALAQSGTMNAVNWATGSKFLQVEIDSQGGNSFVDMGASQLQSVPYAIYASAAAPSGNAGGDLSGTYPNPKVSKIQGADVSNAVPNTGQVLKWNGNVWIPSDEEGALGTLNSALPIKTLTSGRNSTISIEKAGVAADGYLSKADWLTFNGKASTGYVDAAVSTVIVPETNRATAAEATLTTNLNAEVTRATTAEATKESLANKSTNVSTDAASDTKYPSVKSVKSYVDASILSSASPDASGTVKGKLQLAGDLAGTAALPTIAAGAIDNSKIAVGAAIADTKLATISTAGKVLNSATTAASANTMNALVARDASGNFSAGTITAALTGNASTASSASRATNIDGGLPGGIPYQSASGATSILPGNTSTAQKFLTQTGNGTVSAAPVWSVLTAGDIPSLAASYLPLSGGTLSGGIIGTTAALSGNTSIGGTLGITGNLTASGTANSLGTITTGTWNAGAVTSSGAVTGSSIVKSGGTAAQLLAADGSVVTAGTNITISSGTISASGGSVREVADEFTATASQTSFTLSQTPSANSKVKMYINGVRISNTAYGVSGAVLTYTTANNGSYDLLAGDRVQFDFYY